MSTLTLPYKDPSLPVETRVADLVARMTLVEKVSQMLHDAPAVERLDIPAYNWWNECLHGVGRAGIATVFPQAIGLAATWHTDLIHRTAVAISDEARAKHHEALRNGNRGQYYGLTFWTPNINIFRDPRWGRGQETYGEDPYLTARMGVAFVKGLQGDDPKYLKLVATPKHYAVHSGPEHARHHFDVDVSERDLRTTYLPAFEATVKEGRAASVMGAYQRFRGAPCCASPLLLQHILRDEWGFDGYVVSDCGAISDIYKHHKVVATAAEAAALAVKAGCELNCGETYPALLEAFEKGLIDEATIDQAVRRLFTARFRLGMFDPPEMVPYAQIPYAVNDSAAHKQLALEVARESIVLLKNAGGFLPLRKDLKSVAVIGPNADWEEVLLGNYNGFPSEAITPLAGIRAALAPGARVMYAEGCGVTGQSRAGFDEAVAIARDAEVAIVVLGLSQAVEGEEGQREGVEEGQQSQADRDGLNLPGVQEALLQAVHATGTPVVLVLLNGSAVAINWADEHVPAIVEAWYPGQAGGTALAEVLFGDYNPAGRLPVTFYRSVDDLPPFEDYAMAGRTYRYFTGAPLYPFGHGLSYTRFAYRDLHITPAAPRAGEPVTVSATVQNARDRAGDEVVQVYLTDEAASVPVPVRQLVGFARVHLAPGAQQTVSFTISARQMAIFDDAERWVVEPGAFAVAVGGGQPGYAEGVAGSFTVTGEAAVVA
ncbi:MAG: glycoside hydrolase family 3 C-terminal domain-containing protein [Anaerolineae bacterium]